MSRAKDANGLTVKQEAFVQAYLKTGNASEAYRQAYNAAKMKPEAIQVEACRLLASPNVALSVKTRQAKSIAKAQEALDITVESLTRMLIEDRELARANNDAGNAVKAVDALGKLHGLVVEKKHVTSDNRHHHKSETVSETSAWIAGLLGDGADGEAEKPLSN